jgi:hypothetical protein
VGADAWPFLLSLPAVHPTVTVPTMFHGRVAVLPVVAIIADIKVNSDSISTDVATRFQIKLHLQQWARASAAPRRPANNSFTKFNQAWVAES